MGSIGIIGGADGPTAILVSEPDPMSMFVMGIVLGAVIGAVVTLAVIGIIKLIKKNKKK